MLGRTATSLSAMAAILCLAALVAGCGHKKDHVSITCFPTNLGRPAAQADGVKVKVRRGKKCPSGFTAGPQVDSSGNCTSFGVAAGTCAEPVKTQPAPPPPVKLHTVTAPPGSTITVQTTP